jgi:hypothetical protein
MISDAEQPLRLVQFSSVTLREECRLRVLRRMSGLKKEDVRIEKTA